MYTVRNNTSYFPFVKLLVFPLGFSADSGLFRIKRMHFLDPKMCGKEWASPAIN